MRKRREDRSNLEWGTIATNTIILLDLRVSADVNNVFDLIYPYNCPTGDMSNFVSHIFWMRTH